MLKIEDYKSIFVVAGLTGLLLSASPILGTLLHFPEYERFSELWILGQGHMAGDYPFNIRVGERYTVYVGVSNHLGHSAYYLLHVKLRNQTEPLPNVTVGMPSPLSPLFTYSVFVENGEIWEHPLIFSFNDISFGADRCFVSNLNINGVTFTVDKFALWDSENNGYFYQLLVELWLYDVSSKTFHFHNRFVGLWLKIAVI